MAITTGKTSSALGIKDNRLSVMRFHHTEPPESSSRRSASLRALTPYDGVPGTPPEHPAQSSPSWPKGCHKVSFSISKLSERAEISTDLLTSDSTHQCRPRNVHAHRLSMRQRHFAHQHHDPPLPSRGIGLFLYHASPSSRRRTPSESSSPITRGAIPLSSTRGASCPKPTGNGSSTGASIPVAVRRMTRWSEVSARCRWTRRRRWWGSCMR